MAAALRANIVAKRLDGSEYIARFARHGRFKVKVPSGEELLTHATFDECGRSRGTILIRASVSIPCHPDEPYRDVVEFAFSPEEWDMPRKTEHTESELAPTTKARNNVRKQAMAILAIGAALVAAEATMGTMSWAKKKAYETMDWIDEKTAFDRSDPRISSNGRHDPRHEHFPEERVVDPFKQLSEKPLDQ